MIGVNLEIKFTCSFLDGLTSEFCCVTKCQLVFELHLKSVTTFSM